MKKKKYCVYISQINQECLEVSSETEQDAIEKACILWKREYAVPYVTCVIQMSKREATGSN